ncbi:MAG: Gfo/Idh/MocA family oxidoreductase, partial [Planctomycetota bacterium]
MKLRLGLVGLGPSWATRHRPALQALASRFDVRAVCDPVAHRAEQVAGELGARAIDGYRRLAAAEDVDALAILSARWFGALPIVAACDHGKAVYCGASIDLNAAEAELLRRRVRESGIAFMAEFANRLAPATVRLQELIATRLGPPRMIFCNQRDTAGGGGVTGADASMRHLVEMVDWCRYVMGSEPEAVVGAAHRLAGESAGDDYSLMTLGFAPPGRDRGESNPSDRADQAAAKDPPDSERSADKRVFRCGLICPVAWVALATITPGRGEA